MFNINVFLAAMLQIYPLWSIRIGSSPGLNWPMDFNDAVFYAYARNIKNKKEHVIVYGNNMMEVCRELKDQMKEIAR